MTPLSPAATTCLIHLRELYRALDASRGTHDQTARILVVRQIKEVCDQFLRLTKDPPDADA